MYSAEKTTGLRELFNLVTDNNEKVEVYSLRGSVDNQIYVRIRGTGEGGRLIWGAGPKSKWDLFGKKKEKEGEMSKTFRAIYDLVKETKGEIKEDDYIKRLKNNSIYVNEKYVDMNHYQIIVEIYDPEFVAYKGGRKQIGKSDTSSSTSKKEIKVDIDLNKKVKEEKKAADLGKDKRGITKASLSTDTKR
eukprot:TRINITY_DN5864_c0_g1_i1.p1 TRINITY_DN5864_c0_g1~~TRINITY_DN5864_c0_g1_i1.p1  ORF type:complete len:190 (-),score=84.23 TRINITY_DN5864_c0_g1_i1:98-667(-)